MRRELSHEEELTPAGPRAAAGAPPELAADERDLEPLSAVRILDTAFELYAGRFFALTAAAAIPWFGARLLQPFFGKHVIEGIESPDAMLLQMFGVLLAMGGAVLVQTLALGLVALLAWPALSGRRAPTRAAVARALRRLPGLLLILIITGLGVFAGVFTCGVLSVYLAWKMALAPVVYVLEPGGIGDALSRSWDLTRGAFLRWLGVVVVSTTLAYFFGALSGFADEPVLRRAFLEATQVPVALFDGVVVVLSTLFNGISTAVTTLALVVLYRDALVRREGIDLRRRLQAFTEELAAPARAVAAEPQP